LSLVAVVKARRGGDDAKGLNDGSMEAVDGLEEALGFARGLLLLLFVGVPTPSRRRLSLSRLHERGRLISSNDSVEIEHELIK
jgi:hypothetical protein